MQSIELEKGHIYAYLPSSETGLRLWTHMERDSAEELFRLIGDGVALFCVADCNWDEDLSPWPAKACFKGGADFSGGGPAHLSWLHKVIPQAEDRVSVNSSAPRVILGYSLAGLFALYALMESDLFTCAASVSGSLWFDGFLEYMRARKARFAQRKVYLSLGDREAKTRNARLACILDRTLETRDLLSEAGAQVYFTLNPGNHFQEPTQRCARAVEWIKEQV